MDLFEKLDKLAKLRELRGDFDELRAKAKELGLPLGPEPPKQARFRQEEDGSVMVSLNGGDYFTAGASREEAVEFVEELLGKRLRF
jgi:hypothetical protein